MLPAARPSPEASQPAPISLRANAAWTFLGNVVYAGCQWGMLVAFAKFGNARMVGEFGLGLAVTSPIFMFANLQLASVLATDAEGASTFNDYVGTRLLTTAAALLASCIAAVATGGLGTTAAVIVAVAAAKTVESLGEIFQGLFQRSETMDRIAKSMILRGAVSLAAVLFAVQAFGSVVAAALLVACASSIVLFGFDVRNGAVLLGGLQRVAPRFQARRVLALVRIALPLGVVTMLISLTTNIPRYFLEHHGGSRELGIFVGLAYVVTASSTAVGAIGRAATPRLADLHAAERMPVYRSLVRNLVLCGVALGVAGLGVALLAGRPLLRILYSAEYAAHAHEFAIVMLAGGIGYAGSLLGYAVTAGRHFFAQIPLWIVIVGSTCVASAVLVTRLGVAGAAWALVVSAAVQLACYGALYARCVTAAPHGDAA
jgi:O-antigen/teichoic acid export membrane protein